MVWILEWSYPYDSDSYVIIFDSEELALKQACSEIVDHINENLDVVGDQEHYMLAVDIQKLIDNKEYSKAIRHWGHSDVNCDNDHSQYWSVYEREVKTISDMASIGKIHLPKQDIDSSDKNEDNVPVKENMFVATECGAKCRSCNNYNEYAYADNSDGTHECYSCRSFHKMYS